MVRIVSVSCGVVVPGVVSGVSSDGVGVVWLLVSPSCSIYPLRPCGSVRFPRIGLKPGNVHRFCQLVFLTRFARLRSSSLVFARCPLAAGACRFPFRLVPLLVLPVSWGVSWLFFAARQPSHLVHQFAGVSSSNSFSFRSGVSSGGPVFRLVHRSSVFRFVRLIVSRLVRSSRLGVSSSSPHSLVLSGSSSWRFVVSGSVLASRSFLFSSYIARCVSWPWRRLVICGLVSLISWLRVSFSVVICHRGAWRWRGERAVRRYERCAVFVSSFPHRVMMMWRYE